MRPGPILLLIVAAHLVLATIFNFVTPYRTGGWVAEEFRQDIGAPDELAHTLYVDHLLRHQRIPVLRPEDPDAKIAYQSHQAPLFYILDAVWAKAARCDNLISQPCGHWARGLNAIFGGVFVLYSCWLIKWAFERDDLALATAASVALLPMNVALSGALSNDVLLFALCTASLAHCVRGVRYGFTWRDGIIAGLTGGLAMITKTTAVALFVPLALSIIVTKVKRPIPVAAFAIAGSIGVLWWLRNLSIYGDLFAQSAFLKTFKPDANAPWTAWIHSRLDGSTTSFLGNFGYLDVQYHRLIYAAFWLLVIVGLLLNVRGKGVAPCPRPITWLLAGFTLTVIFLWVLFNLTYVQPQARYFFPALPILLVLPIAGLISGPQPEGRITWRATIMPLALFVLCLVAIAILPPAFKSRIAKAQELGYVTRITEAIPHPPSRR